MPVYRKEETGISELPVLPSANLSLSFQFPLLWSLELWMAAVSEPVCLSFPSPLPSAKCRYF